MSLLPMILWTALGATGPVAAATGAVARSPASTQRVALEVTLTGTRAVPEGITQFNFAWQKILSDRVAADLRLPMALRNDGNLAANLGNLGASLVFERARGHGHRLGLKVGGVLPTASGAPARAETGLAAQHPDLEQIALGVPRALAVTARVFHRFTGARFSSSLWAGGDVFLSTKGQGMAAPLSHLGGRLGYALGSVTIQTGVAWARSLSQDETLLFGRRSLANGVVSAQLPLLSPLSEEAMPGRWWLSAKIVSPVNPGLVGDMLALGLGLTRAWY